MAIPGKRRYRCVGSGASQFNREEVATTYTLIVWNDDVNTFDWVIDSLMDICDHTPEQAEQCALLIHYKGKCGVKKGSFDDLRPKAEALIDRGIQSTVDY